MEKLNLRKKLLEVSKAIKYLKKDKRNTGQNYNYLSEAKIKEIIKAEFEKQGVLFNYSTEDITQYEISPTHKGTKQFVTNIKGTYNFLDVDSEVGISGTWGGSGMDTGDKGLYKAITGGIKYVLNTNFLIPSGDDPENDDKTKTETKPAYKKPEIVKTDTKYPPVKDTDVRLITEGQVGRFFGKGTENGWKPEELKELIKTFGYEHSKDIQRKDYEKIIEMIEKGIADIPHNEKQADLLKDIKAGSDKKVHESELDQLDVKALGFKKQLWELSGDDIAYGEILGKFDVSQPYELTDKEQKAELVTALANAVLSCKKGEKDDVFDAEMAQETNQ